jgi:hypothetical protein
MLIEAMKSAGPKMMVSMREAAGVLDLGLDADAPDLEAHGLLDLGERQVEPGDLLGGLDLGQHDAVEVGTGALDDLDDVTVGPLGGEVVDPHDADLAVPAALVEGIHDDLAGARLGERRAGVLEVEEHHVGRQATSLVDHLRVGAGDREAGPARTVTRAHGRMLARRPAPRPRGERRFTARGHPVR